MRTVLFSVGLSLGLPLGLSVGCTGGFSESTDVFQGADASLVRDSSVDSAIDAFVAGDAGIDSVGDRATCATLPEFVAGTNTCRDEAGRCSVSIPSATSCDDACGAIGFQCLRVYNESELCLAAVERGELTCDAAPGDTGFCQCGDRAVAHDDWLVVTIGDSIMSNRGVPGESGWGDELPIFAVRPSDIHNQGSSGASSLDFETRPNWAAAEGLLGPNAFLLIQFGHNDLAADAARHTEPGEPPEFLGTFRDRLAFYVAAARAKGATPIIATPSGIMVVNPDGSTPDMSVTVFAQAAIRYAQDEGLLLIDGHRISRAEYGRLGLAETLARYSFDENQHYSVEGARRFAELVVRGGCIESEEFCAQFSLP